MSIKSIKRRNSNALDGSGKGDDRDSRSASPPRDGSAWGRERGMAKRFTVSNLNDRVNSYYKKKGGKDGRVRRMSLEEFAEVANEGRIKRQKKLEVLVVGASNLPKMDFFGSCDAYVVLWYNGYTFRTRPVKGKLDPEYGHIFVFDLNVKGGEPIVGEIFDWNTTKKHDLIGKFTVRVPDTIDASNNEVTIVEKVYGEDGRVVRGVSHRDTTVTLKLRKAERTRNIRLPDYAFAMAEFVHQEDLEEDGPPPPQLAHLRGWQPPSLREVLEGGERKGKLHEVKVKEAERHSKMTFLVSEMTSKKSATAVTLTWREKLAKRMNSVYVNIAILFLVLMDLVGIFVFEFGVSESDKDCFNRMLEPEVIITLIVLTCFSIEIVCRVIAHGRAFFRVGWNIFDLVVVTSSLGLAVWKIGGDLTMDVSICDLKLGRSCAWPDILKAGYVDPNGVEVCEVIKVEGIAGADEVSKNLATSTKASRVLSRVAVGLRFVRAFMGINRARMLQGDVLTNLRQAVGGTKRRYFGDGFNLDLTYITNRLVAMSTPGFGAHKDYRNDIAHVARFLTLKHYGKFRVYNLCEEHEGNYHPALLYYQMRRVAFDDHNPPTMRQILIFCQNALDFVRQDARNIVSVHCKGGKGRTGVMAAAWLMVTGHRQTAIDALELFAFRRTTKYKMGHHHNQTVEGPSQIRYCHYLEATLYHNVNAVAEPTMIITAVCFPAGPGKPGSVKNYLSVLVLSTGRVVYNSRFTEDLLPCVRAGHPHVFIIPPTIVRGDVKIEVYRHEKANPKSACVGKSKYSSKDVWPSCQVVFHTAYHTDQRFMSFEKFQVDYSHKDRHHSEFVKDFGMAVHFADLNPSDPLNPVRPLVLHITVESARDLLSADITGLSDPMARLILDGKAWANTHSVRQTLHPEWNCDFVMPLQELPGQLDVQVYDTDMIGEDTPIGFGSFSIPKAALSGKKMKAEIGLTEPDKVNKKAGVVHISYHIEEAELPEEHCERVRFDALCMGKGEEKRCLVGQEILPFGAMSQCLFFIAKGMVEVISSRDPETDEPVVHSILGEGDVFGSSCFLVGLPTMQHLAFTDVDMRVLRLETGDTTGLGKEAQISVFSSDEMTLFHKVLATKLSDSYLTLKSETNRIASRTLHSDNDNTLVLEQQRSELRRLAISTFMLPATEQCQYLGQMVSVYYMGRQRMCRILFMSTVLIIEPSVYGTDVLEASEDDVIDMRRILRVEDLADPKLFQGDMTTQWALEIFVQDKVAAYDNIVMAMGRHTIHTMIFKFPNYQAFIRAKDLLQHIAEDYSKFRSLSKALPGSKFNNHLPFLEALLFAAASEGNMCLYKPHEELMSASYTNEEKLGSIFFVCKGQAKVLGSDNKVMWVVYAGDMHGETQFLGSSHSGFRLIAGDMGCEVVLLKKNFLLQKCKEDPALGKDLYRGIAMGLAEKTHHELKIQYGAWWLTQTP